MPDEEYDKLLSEDGYIEINAICRCNKNEWNGSVSAQLLLEDYEICRLLCLCVLRERKVILPHFTFTKKYDIIII